MYTITKENLYIFPDELLGDLSEYKSVECWSVGDILNWLIAESKELNICYTKLCGEKFVLLNGAELLQMKLKDFIEITPDYGRHLYNSIQRISKSVLPPYTDRELSNRAEGVRSSLIKYNNMDVVLGVKPRL